MNEQIDLFKIWVRELRGWKSRKRMSNLCNMSSKGSWQSLEHCGNPQLLTLLKISKGANIKFVIEHGEIKKLKSL